MGRIDRPLLWTRKTLGVLVRQRPVFDLLSTIPATRRPRPRSRMRRLDESPDGDHRRERLAGFQLHDIVADDGTASPDAVGTDRRER
jgi:hypothetical protein